MGTLKRSQQSEKKANANMLEEARKREDNVSDEASQLKVGISPKGISNTQHRACFHQRALNYACCLTDEFSPTRGL